mmetsp:Transcript_27920/g.71044  ORF Transcript_27920/g.71044 Transcript_27920/m.71044 type:complete len:310 (-) Transcript_27920:192-1121(-)
MEGRRSPLFPFFFLLCVLLCASVSAEEWKSEDEEGSVGGDEVETSLLSSIRDEEWRLQWVGESSKEVWVGYATFADVDVDVDEAEVAGDENGEGEGGKEPECVIASFKLKPKMDGIGSYPHADDIEKVPVKICESDNRQNVQISIHSSSFELNANDMISALALPTSTSEEEVEVGRSESEKQKYGSGGILAYNEEGMVWREESAGRKPTLAVALSHPSGGSKRGVAKLRIIGERGGEDKRSEEKVGGWKGGEVTSDWQKYGTLAGIAIAFAVVRVLKAKSDKIMQAEKKMLRMRTQKMVMSQFKRKKEE